MSRAATIRGHIKRLARLTGAGRLMYPAQDGNLYEALLFLTVIEAIQSAGYNPTLLGGSGSSIRLRGSPGQPSLQYSWAEFMGKTGSTYQVWNSLEVTGHSGMDHEVDVGVFRVDTPGQLPQADLERLVIAIEAKCYSSASLLKSVSRTYLGLVTDLSHTSHRCTLGACGCIHCGTGFAPNFVTNVPQGSRTDIEQYLSRYGLSPVWGVLGSQGRHRLQQQLLPILQKL